MLLELADRRAAPVRCLTCLSARAPRVRLAGARALERFADPAAFRAYVVELVNDRGDEPPWKIPADTVEPLAQLLAAAPPAVRARTAYMLLYLSEKEPAAWEQAWALHTSRFTAEVRAVREAARERKLPAPQYTPAQLQDLAFGAYVGLVREQGGSTTAGHGTESQVVRVRQTALARLQEMARAGRQASARPVLVQALSDPNQAVRLQAFDQLAALGMDADALGAAALGAGHTDVGVRGLEKLAGGGTSAEGQAVLEQALRTRTDDLATEAAKLLAARRGLVPVAGLALTAAHEPLRRQGVDWLAAEYDKGPAARDFLRQALQSRHRKVVAAGAMALAVKKDPAAFDALVRLLGETKEEGPQRRLIAALKELGDPRAVDAFLDRIEHDPEGSALLNDLFDAAGSFRRPETADRLLTMGGQEKWSRALEAALVVSGFDQRIEDPEDEKTDRRWEQKQFPRHDAVLARLLKRTTDLKANRLSKRLVPTARWARGKDVDPPLAVLTVYADDDIRTSAVEAVGWRLRKRGGPAEPLVKGLKHRDGVTQFLAAEGLACGGRAEGLSSLLAAVDLQEDYRLRQRAVRALGELGDARALDLLMKIANDPEHALREEAVEALGRMRRSAKVEEIRELLLNLARAANRLSDSALRGLRWLDHPEGWQVIRRRAADPSNPGLQDVAIELLGYNDDPATREVLLRLLAGGVDYEMLETALTAARRLWGEESLEPDYAVVRNTEIDPDVQEGVLRRLQERGDARRLLEILPRLDAETAGRLKGILLSRQPLPVAEAQAVVAGPDAAAAGVAAHLLGRAGAAESGPPVAAALARWWGEWDKGRQEETRRGAVPGKLVGHLLEPLRSLVWAAGRLGVAADTLRVAATARADVPYDRPLRRAAVVALAGTKPSKPVLTALAGLATGDDPEIRATAATAVGQADGTRAADLAGQLLSDRVAFNRVAGRAGDGLTAVLRGAAAQVHYQGVTVPHLAGRRDVATLAAVANNGTLPEAARLGAIEGLAAAATEAGEAELKRLAEAQENPEELRKAAGRGLRRSRRARQRAAAAEVKS
jgi:ParB family chromosome partitioning protein